MYVLTAMYGSLIVSSLVQCRYLAAVLKILIQ